MVELLTTHRHNYANAVRMGLHVDCDCGLRDHKPESQRKKKKTRKPYLGYVESTSLKKTNTKKTKSDIYHVHSNVNQKSQCFIRSSLPHG